MAHEADRQKRRHAEHQAWKAMAEAAATREPVTYGDLANRIDAISYAPNGGPFKDLLTKISRQTHSVGRGLLSAVVVHADDGLPGDGFYELGRELGFEFTNEEQFWRERLEEVYERWGA